MIPTHPTLTWFNSLNSIITKFYWKNKTPRIKLTTLQKPKLQGGLDAPHFYFYSLANQLQYIYKWTHPSHSDHTWLDIEQTLCKDIQISDIPFLSQSIKRHPCFNALTIASALTAWWKFHKITNSTLSPSNFTPIWNNPDLTSNKKTLNFRTWAEKGITHFKHIFHNSTLVSFPYLVQEHGIGSNHFLEYLQLKSSVQSKINIRTTNLSLSPEISQLANIHSPKRLLSQIYKIISHSDNSIVLPSNKWEQDLSITPDADFWTQICKNIYLMTKNANLQLIQYKILHRTHYTGQKMFKMGFTSETCAHCTQNCPDTYIHATWHCTPIEHFWKEVIGSLSDLMDCRIPLSPSLCLLGDTTTLTIDKTNHRLLLTSLTIAKKTILINWKSRNTIHLTHWKNLLIDHISLEYSPSPPNSTTEPLATWPKLIDLLTS